MIRLIHILSDGVESDVDEARLVKTEGVLDNDNECTTWVEYRWPGADAVIHRSVHVVLKQWPDGLSGAVQSLG